MLLGSQKNQIRDSPKKLPKSWVRSFHTTLLIFSYLLGQLIAYIALALL